MNMVYKAFKNLIRGTLRRSGYEVIRTHNVSGNFEYERIRPTAATYAPWNRDKLFLDTYNSIEPYTHVDMYRCYELWTLVEQSRKLTGGLIEIGAWKGGTGAIIAKKAKSIGIADPVYLCDTFDGVVKAGVHDTLYKGGEHADTSHHIVETLMCRQLALDNVKILKGIFPEQTSHLIEEKVFRFCHIDVDVYQSAKDIMDWIWDRMVIGGIVVYDDYGFVGCDGITKYVEEQKFDDDRLFLYNLNGHAIIIKIR